MTSTIETQIPAPKWCFVPSITELFCLILGSILVYTYAWLMDDAYVYFRYVDNFVIHGQGLVWNPGEYVEGFSSPIWALLLSALRFLHLNYWLIIRAVGVLSFIAFWWVGCIVNRGLLSPSNQPTFSLNLPLVYLTFTYGFSCYFTSGLEAPLVNLIAVCYAAAILWPNNKAFQILVGLSPLVRQELLIPCLLFIAYSFLIKKSRPYFVILSFIISVGGYCIFRIWYYADLFPNTFYLKDLTWISQGLNYLFDTLLPYQTIPYLLIMLLVYFFLRNKNSQELGTTERLVMLALSLPVVAYVIKIGGDPRHFRYLSFPFILIVFSSAGLAENFVQNFTKSAQNFSSLFVIIFGVAAFTNYPRQLEEHPILRVPMQDINHQINKIGDAAAHRLRKNRLTPPWGAAGRYLSYAEAQSQYQTEFNQKQILDTRPWGEVIPANIVKPGKTLANLPIISDSWCQNGYLHPALPIIHNLGLTEPFLARVQMHSDRPAHKYGLRPLALDILRVRSEYGFIPGAFDLALAADANTASWIGKNIESIRKIESKVYNQHDFLKNLELAFTRVQTIIP